MGIRQRDPMSPSFFVVVMVLFTQIIQNSAKEMMFHLHRKCQDLHITRLSFAYDLIAFMNNDWNTTLTFKENLEVFKGYTRLVVNVKECQVLYCGIHQDLWDEFRTLCSFLGEIYQLNI